MIVLMARSLYWPEYEKAERGNAAVQRVWLELTGSWAREAMVKLNTPRQ